MRIIELQIIAQLETSPSEEVRDRFMADQLLTSIKNFLRQDRYTIHTLGQQTRDVDVSTQPTENDIARGEQIQRQIEEIVLDSGGEPQIEPTDEEDAERFDGLS